jgi:hypothetical protein
MKLREHRGSLEDSMATVVEIPATKEALVKEIVKKLSKFYVNISEESVTVEPYAFDERIGWDSHVVSVKGHGVYGFTDGPLDLVVEFVEWADQGQEQIESMGLKHKEPIEMSWAKLCSVTNRLVFEHKLNVMLSNRDDRLRVFLDKRNFSQR